MTHDFETLAESLLLSVLSKIIARLSSVLTVCTGQSRRPELPPTAAVEALGGPAAAQSVSGAAPAFSNSNSARVAAWRAVSSGVRPHAVSEPAP